MGYSITVESYFSAAHHLKGYRGKCEALHGHNWKVQVKIFSGGLDKTGMVFDFKEAERMLDNILALLDHKQLNKLSFFKRRNPTSELIAELIFNKYQKKLTQPLRAGTGLKPPLRLKSVTVWETPTSCATFEVESRE